MTIPSIPIIRRDGTLTIKDATGSPITATLAYEEGDFQIGGLTQGDLDLMEFRDRGDIYSARTTDQRVLEFSFSCHATALTDATAHILDAVRKTGAYASGVSTWGTNVADPWMVTIVLAVEGTDRGGSDQTLTLTYCRCEADFAEGDPAKLSIKGKAFPKGATAAAVIA
jgi:hypothetical protein